MAELIEIKKVLIGPDNMTAFVRVADDAPLLTSEDVEATARVYHLMPQIVDHACYGDAGETFRDAMGDTEITHLLEHVTVELLAQTDLAGDMPTGRTWVDEVDERTFEIDLACPDDVLVAAALSCGVWILDWAYSGGGDPEPNVDAIVAGLVSLVEGVGDQGEDLVIDYGPLEDEDVISADDLASEGDSADAEIDGLTQDLMRTAEERPLWTPAPEVARIMHRSEENKEPEPEPEVEAEIDEIMATIETPALVVDEGGKAVEPVAKDEAAADDVPEADVADAAEADTAAEAADVADVDATSGADVATADDADAAPEAEAAADADAAPEAAAATDADAVPEAEAATDADAAPEAEVVADAAVEAAAPAAAEPTPEPTAELEPAAADEEPAPREPTGAVAQALAAATAAEAARGRVIAEAREAADAAAEEAAATVIEELAEPAAPELDPALSDIRVIAPATVVPTSGTEVSAAEDAEDAATIDVEDAAETRQEPDA